MDNTHKWLHHNSGVKINDAIEAEEFEALIGDLNGVLEEQYGCRIVYDRDDTKFNCFAVFVKDQDYG
tara:strand:+ start:411 stop:611 length:201 start_codon:yes stop_codon:yes gene_type:complete